MGHANPEGHFTELHELLGAMRSCRTGPPPEDAPRFAIVQRRIADRHGEGCRRTGYPVVARP